MRASGGVHIYLHIYIYIYTYTFVCVRACASVHVHVCMRVGAGGWGFSSRVMLRQKPGRTPPHTGRKPIHPEGRSLGASCKS